MKRFTQSLLCGAALLYTTLGWASMDIQDSPLYTALGGIPPGIAAGMWEHSRPVLIGGEAIPVASGTSLSGTATVPADCTLVVFAIGVRGGGTSLDVSSQTLAGIEAHYSGGRSNDDYVGTLGTTGNFIVPCFYAWRTSDVGTGDLAYSFSYSATVDRGGYIFYFKNANAVVIPTQDPYMSRESADSGSPGGGHDVEFYAHGGMFNYNTDEENLVNSYCTFKPTSRFPYILGLACQSHASGGDFGVSGLGTWASNNMDVIYSSNDALLNIGILKHSGLDTVVNPDITSFHVSCTPNALMTSFLLIEVVNRTNGKPYVYTHSEMNKMDPFNGASNTRLQFTLSLENPPSYGNRVVVLSIYPGPTTTAVASNVSITGGANCTVIYSGGNNTANYSNGTGHIVAYAPVPTGNSVNFTMNFTASINISCIKPYIINGILNTEPIFSNTWQSTQVSNGVANLNFTLANQVPDSITILSGINTGRENATIKNQSGNSNASPLLALCWPSALSTTYATGANNTPHGWIQVNTSTPTANYDYYYNGTNRHLKTLTALTWR